MSNQRKHDRIDKSIKCEVHSESVTFSSTLNISEGGVFISTPEPLEKDTVVILYLYVSDYDIIQVDGKVIWNVENEKEESAGMGIEFLDMDEADKELVKKSLG
jgi:uncharacterized protein (TIGR02266 family)